MNKKNIICVLLIIISLGIYYYTMDDGLVVNTATNLNDQPIYQSDTMTTDIYDVTGEILYNIQSKNVKHFDISNNTEFELPYVTIYDKDQLESWHIKAKQAMLTNDKLLYLYHDVQLDNLTPNTQLKQVTTDNALVDLNTQLVTSKDPVTIKGTGLYSTGIGLAGNMKEKTAKVLENVKTYYNAEAN